MRRLERALEGRRGLVAASAIAVALHLVYLLLPTVPLSSDALEFHRLALGLREHGRFGVDAPMTTFAPGYPVFLAGIYAAFGPHPMAARIVQAILVGALAPGIYLALRRPLGGTAATAAFVGLAVLPPLFIYPATLNAESLVIVLVVALCALALRPISERRGGVFAWAAALGGLCGLLCLTKPEFLVWVPLAAIVAWCRRAHWTHVALTLVASSAAFALVLSPWIARNEAALGRFIPLTTGGGRTLWLTAQMPDFGEYDHAEFWQAQARCAVPGDPKATDDCFKREATAAIRQHPAYYLRRSVHRVVMTLFGSHTDYLPGANIGFREALARRWVGTLAVKAALLGVYTAFVLAGLAGIVWLCRARATMFWGYLVASKLLMHAAVFGTSRYGLQLVPLFAVGGGALVAAIRTRPSLALRMAWAGR